MTRHLIPVNNFVPALLRSLTFWMLLICVGDVGCRIGRQLLGYSKDIKELRFVLEHSMFITTERMLAKSIYETATHVLINLGKSTADDFKPFVISCTTKSYKSKNGTPLDFMNFVESDGLDAFGKTRLEIERAKISPRGDICYVEEKESFLMTVEYSILQLIGRTKMDSSPPTPFILTDATDSFGMTAVYITKFCKKYCPFVISSSLSRYQCLHPLGYVCYLCILAGLLKYSDLYIELPRPPDTFSPIGRKIDNDTEYAALSLLSVLLRPSSMIPLPPHDLRVATTHYGKYARIIVATSGMTKRIGVKAVAQCAAGLLGRNSCHGILLLLCSDVAERWISDCEKSLKSCIINDPNDEAENITSLCYGKFSRTPSLTTLCSVIFWSRNVSLELETICHRVDMLIKAHVYQDVFRFGPISSLVIASSSYIKELARKISAHARALKSCQTKK